MPELPEVEVVRRGLEKHLVGLHFTAVEVLDSRPLRKHVGGPASFVDQLVGRQVQAAVRRGKFFMASSRRRRRPDRSSGYEWAATGP